MGLRGGICGHAVHLYAASADEILLLGTPGAMVKNGEKWEKDGKGTLQDLAIYCKLADSYRFFRALMSVTLRQSLVIYSKPRCSLGACCWPRW